MFGQVFIKTNFRFERKKISLNLNDINETHHKKNGLFGKKNKCIRVLYTKMEFGSKTISYRLNIHEIKINNLL